MGSKHRLSKDLVPILNTTILDNNIKTYIEPFVGGANIIEHIECSKKIGSDNNEFLIEMWNKLIMGWNPPNEMSRETYNNIKNNKKDYPKYMVAIAGFCATYNAKWFGGYAGLVKTKVGTIRNYYDESIRNILSQINKLKDVEFLCCDYKQYSNTKNSLFYCDPPYENTTKYKDEFKHEEFWEWVRLMSKNNIVFVSEYNAPEDFECVYEKQLTTTLDKNSRKKDIEKLFIHKSS